MGTHNKHTVGFSQNGTCQVCPLILNTLIPDRGGLEDVALLGGIREVRRKIGRNYLAYKMHSESLFPMSVLITMA